MPSSNDHYRYSNYSLKELYNLLSDNLSDSDRQELTNELSKRLEHVFAETLQGVYTKNNIGRKFHKQQHNYSSPAAMWIIQEHRESNSGDVVEKLKRKQYRVRLFIVGIIVIIFALLVIASLL